MTATFELQALVCGATAGADLVSVGNGVGERVSEDDGVAVAAEMQW